MTLLRLARHLTPHRSAPLRAPPGGGDVEAGAGAMEAGRLTYDAASGLVVAPRD